jgi:hypothetical protein
MGRTALLVKPEDKPALEKLTKDLQISATLLTPHQARYLVDLYYQIQDTRVGTGNQAIQLGKSEEPNEVVAYFARQLEIIEDQIRKALDKYTSASEIGIWAKSITGIGPVISAGLVANINPEHCISAAKVWRFCGLAPGQKRERGKKLDFNPSLKRLSWLIGESFVKVSNHPNDYYGNLYKKRKELEEGYNEEGKYSDQAKEAITVKKYRDDTKAKKIYEQGKLPPGHIHARAKRYAAKMFIAHFAAVYYESTFKKKAPEPYAIVHLGHVDYLPPPNWP